MTGLAVFLVLLSAVLHAFKSLFTKTSQNKYVFTLLYWIGGDLLIMPPIFAYFLLNDVSEMELLAAADAKLWFVMGISIFFHAIYFFTQSKIYIKGDLSLVYPLSRLAPLFVLLWGLFILHEDISTLGLIGVILTVIGTWVIMLEKGTFKSLFKAIFKVKELTIALAFLTSIVSAIFSISDREAVLHFGPLLFAIILSIDLLICGPIVVFKYGKDIKREWRESKKNIILTSFFDYPGYLLVLFAFLIAPLTYVIALRQISVVIGVVFGYLLLKEPYGRFRIAGSIVIFIGSFLISVLG